MEENEVVLDELVDDNQKGRYMTFQLGEKYYGIGISYVNEIIGLQPVTKVPETEDFIIGLINLRGKILPVIDVRIRFGMEPRPYDDRTCIIVINVESVAIGLVVDTIAEVVTIADEDILPPPTISPASGQTSRYVFGIGKVGNEVKMLLDLKKLIAHDDAEKTTTSD